MKTNLGDAKSQLNQNTFAEFLLTLFSIFTSGQNYPMSHPPYDVFIENAHEKSSLNLQLSTPCKDLTPHLTRDFEM